MPKLSLAALPLVLAACSLAPTRHSTMVDCQDFGRGPAGEPIEIYTLRNSRGTEARISTLGATLVSFEVADRQGQLADVVLGFDDASGYLSEANQYFGCTTGRVANRIAKGRFSLGGRDYQLACNNGPNHLHGGGPRSLDKVVWQAEPSAEGLYLRYTSPDREEGYPGELRIEVCYSLSEADVLRISYRAECDQATPVNLTNHAYWNLSGAGAASVLEHELQVFAEQYTPVDADLIPTGELRGLAGSPLDLREPRPIGAGIPALAAGPTQGYDHNYVLSAAPGLKRAARLYDPASGRVMEVWTTEPGLQVYSGNFLSGQRGKQGRRYAQRSALCLEAQHFPDAVNQPSFPGIILQPGEVYRQVTEHRFSQRH